MLLLETPIGILRRVLLNVGLLMLEVMGLLKILSMWVELLLLNRIAILIILLLLLLLLVPWILLMIKLLIPTRWTSHVGPKPHLILHRIVHHVLLRVMVLLLLVWMISLVMLLLVGWVRMKPSHIVELLLLLLLLKV